MTPTRCLFLPACLLLLALAVPAAAAPAAAPDLRVMSFNLRYATAPDGANAWEHRHDLLVDVIKAFGPDVLGTQECLLEQATFLQSALDGYAWVGVGRDDGDKAGEMCAVFYRSDRLEPVAQGHFWLSDTPDVVGSRGWDAALPRIATWVKLRERADTTQEPDGPAGSLDDGKHGGLLPKARTQAGSAGNFNGRPAIRQPEQGAKAPAERRIRPVFRRLPADKRPPAPA